MVMIDGPIPPEVKELSESERFNAIFKYHASWVSSANNELQAMGYADKIVQFSHMLDKFSRGMNAVTKELYASVEDISDNSSELDNNIASVKRIKDTFYYFVNFNESLVDVNYSELDKIYDIEGAYILISAFADYESLKHNSGEDEMIGLIHNVLNGVYETTKHVCRYEGDIDMDKYLSELDDLVNIFGSDDEVQVVDN